MEASGLPEHAAPVGGSAELTEIDPTTIAARSPWQLFWRRFKDDKLALASLIFLFLLVLVAIFAPLVVKIVGAPGPDYRDTERPRHLRDPDRPEPGSHLRRRPARPRRLQPHRLRRARLA